MFLNYFTEKLIQMVNFQLNLSPSTDGVCGPTPQKTLHH